MSYFDGWEKFGDRVGWRKDGDWLSYSNLTFDLDKSLKGEFPAFCRFGGKIGHVYFGGCSGFSFLAQRLVNCSKSQF